MARVVTFGEIMLRLAPEGYNRFVQAESLGVVYGGAEANVAVSLANMGMDAAFVTKLPSHEIGQSAVNSIRRYGVDTSKIVRGGDRVGIYFLEKGASQRPSKVVYDRAGSSIAAAEPGDFDWPGIFKDADWFHFTGITPAIGGKMPEICLDACMEAKKRGLTVSCDINYRRNLWGKEKARKTLLKLMEYVDVCITNGGQMADIFDLCGEDDQLSREDYIRMAKELAVKYSFDKIALTMRESISASDNNWSAMLYDGKEAAFSRQYKMHIIDRVGGGDGFGAGIIYALTAGMKTEQTIEFAAAAGCLKHSIEGDYNLVSVDEILGLAEGDGSGRVRR